MLHRNHPNEQSIRRYRNVFGFCFFFSNESIWVYFWSTNLDIQIINSTSDARSEFSIQFSIRWLIDSIYFGTFYVPYIDNIPKLSKSSVKQIKWCENATIPFEINDKEEIYIFFLWKPTDKQPESNVPNNWFTFHIFRHCHWQQPNRKWKQWSHRQILPTFRMYGAIIGTSVGVPCIQMVQFNLDFSTTMGLSCKHCVDRPTIFVNHLKIENETKLQMKIATTTSTTKCLTIWRFTTMWKIKKTITI